ncbi:hypothetical protein [Streptomyces millisiae]|uniref:SseB protein N-terminal domain-containing protein n=1 Tax=Streptomyces millisiae TaxID=3075542 RepID=A0ABU2LLR3_9ACTN|nr:hypothetical protein [Streptomyces sp. DSM 44918]MDT0318519.1 hypothetical protein [Streptomyces sp. DSM 44918]
MPDFPTTRRRKPLTVGQLKTVLCALPDDMLVVLSSDGEGNRYSPLLDLAQAMYLDEAGGRGRVYPTSEELRRDTGARDLLSPDAIPADAVAAVLLYPMR